MPRPTSKTVVLRAPEVRGHTPKTTPKSPKSRFAEAASMVFERNASTRIQAHVPQEWRQTFIEWAAIDNVTESDVLRALLGEGLGVLKPWRSRQLPTKTPEAAKTLPKTKPAAYKTEAVAAKPRKESVKRAASTAPGDAVNKRTSQYEGVFNNPDFQKMTSTHTDREVSVFFAVPLSAVQMYRRRTGTESFAAQRRAAAIPLLGTMPDEELAAKFEYSVSGVVALRKRHNIPPFGMDAATYAAATAAAATKPKRIRRTKAEMAAARAAAEMAKTVGAPKAAAAPTTVANQVTGPAEVSEITTQEDTVAFLQKRHKAGDSTEALAARLDIPEAQIKQLLGL